MITNVVPCSFVKHVLHINSVLVTIVKVCPQPPGLLFRSPSWLCECQGSLLHQKQLMIPSLVTLELAFALFFLPDSEYHEDSKCRLTE